MNGHLPIVTLTQRSIWLILFGLIVLTLVLTNIRNVGVLAAVGDLDPTFGVGGVVVTDFGIGSGATSVLLQADGKIVGVGGGAGFMLARYNTDGSLDFSFGTGGKVTTEDFATCFAATLQSDEKVVAVGLTYKDNHPVYALARYNTDGTLDTTYGSGGKVVLDLYPGFQGIALAAVIQPDDRVIAVGNALHDGIVSMLLVRYNTNGSVDTSFGSNGLAFFASFAGIYSAVRQADGKVVIVGYSFPTNSSASYAALMRVNPDGSADVPFGVNGRVFATISGRGDFAYSAAIQKDGKILTSGISFTDIGIYHFATMRFNRDGSLDGTFGTGGRVITPIEGYSRADGMAIQANGKIVVVGASVSGFDVVRYNPDGSLDSTFGAGGKIITPVGRLGANLAAVTLQSDGKIVGAGYIGNNFGLVRYLGDPPFDLCIQDESNGNILQVNTTTGDYQFSNCAGLTLGGTGTLNRRGSTIALQHNSTDRRVTATLDRSTNRATASVQLLSQGRTFSITDRNIANNTCACKGAE